MDDITMEVKGYLHNHPVLHLNLIKKWFDMIESGEKQEEYRGIKPFYDRILGENCIKIKGVWYRPSEIVICFSNGYSKTRRQMLFNCNAIKKGCGKTKWGAKANKEYYIIHLGNKIAG